MDEIDKRLVNILQIEFPIVKKPFEVIAVKLGIQQSEVIARVSHLIRQGIIRRIGAIFSPDRMGMVATLIALRVADESELERVARVINSFKEVTHNYLRDHYYNLWFTIVATDEDKLKNIIAEIKHKTNIDEIVEFRTKRAFKIDARFLLS
ncbi:MAG: AsnC family transcriptional regulator [Candidatus Sumerlaeia bacterium]|nr:AsnC family transcriptional regulator [Candidatus Sumerlaeia bacterium]